MEDYKEIAMQRYDTYKDSGVKWLGEIPSHWEVKRFKHFGTFSKGKLPKNTNLDGIGFPIIGASEMKGKEPSVFTEDINVPHCLPYEILILWDGANAGLVANNKKGVVASTAVKYTCIDDSINDRYLFYLVKNYQRYYKDKVSGTTIPHMNIAFINDTPLLVPKYAEQTAIANYLDTATAKIDAAIAQQQKMIDLLNERKQIIINRAVTKGLNPNAKMKDSGVEWIGEVPEHWEMRRLKTFLSIKDKRNQDEYATLLSVYTSIGVRPRAELEEKGNKASTVMNYKIVNKGDLIVNRLLAWMGAYGLSNYDGVTSPDYDVYSFKKGYCKEFYEILFRNTNFKSDCYKYGHGIMMMRWRTYPNEFLNILVPVPPKEEQEKLLESLKPQIKKIDAGVDKCSQIISLLQERKQIIINEVVTGKVKVG